MSECACLVAEILAAPGCAATKQRVLCVLRRYSGTHIYVSDHAIDGRQRRALVAAIAASGLSRARQTKALAARAGISEATARRWLRALEQ